MTPPVSAVTLSGVFTRTMSDATIRRCANAVSDQQVASLWGRIKDFFLGSNRETAKLAIFHLANARTFDEQFSAFLALSQCIEPLHRDCLRWNILANEADDFQVGKQKFKTARDATDFMKQVATMDLEDRCRLLLAIRVDGHDLISESDHFGLPLQSLVLHKNDTQFGNQCERTLTAMPALRDALQVLGLHRANDENGLAKSVGKTVSKLLMEQRSLHGWMTSAVAERLTLLISALKDRD